MTALPRWLLALAAGAVWGVCFGRQGWLWVPWVALVPLLLLLERPRPVLTGWLHGVAFWLVSIPWIVPTLRVHGQLDGALAVLGLLALASYLALFTALFAGLAAGVWRRGGTAAVLGVPAIWVITEWLRGHLFTGFPWNLAAYAWVDFPGALPLSSWIGPYGLAFLLVATNAAASLAVARGRWRQAAVTWGLVLLALAVGGRWAAPSPAELADGFEVRILQPDIDIMLEWDPGVVEDQYQQIFAMSREACERPGILVVWPESAAWPYSFSRDERLRRDLEELTAAGCPVLVNTSMAGEGGTFNSLLLIGGDQTPQRYDKRHLVPFGEYVPMAGWLPFLDKIARNAGEFLTGDEDVLLPWSGELLAAAICFEITFPEEVAARVRQGGTVLLTVTNDSWYGDSWAPWQHFRAARFRAAENGRFLLRAAITGVSAIVRPDGTIEQQLGVGEQGILAAQVPGSRTLTLYSRAPWAVPVACLLTAAFAILLGRKGNHG